MKQLPRWSIKVQWAPGDLWIGVFWEGEKWEEYKIPTDRGPVCGKAHRLYVWVCLVPCFPILIRRWCW